MKIIVAALAIAVALTSCHRPARAQVIQSYTITLTPPEMTLVGKALGALPYAEVAGTMSKIVGQVSEQNQRAAAPTKTEEAAPKDDKKPAE